MRLNSNLYTYTAKVKENDILRKSFNHLTRQTFSFDFTNWYNSGNWGELYLPHVILDGEKVVSNVSVNRMQFDIGGRKRNYIQFGTVMTDKEYRGQGFNGWLMEQILQEYECRTDGIYLFANDSVLDYYPKFGFRPSKEYEYYMTCNHNETITPYTIEKVDMTQAEQYERFYGQIKEDSKESDSISLNDGMFMQGNLGLYHFWLILSSGILFIICLKMEPM